MAGEMCRYCRGAGELFGEDSDGFTSLSPCPYCMAGFDHGEIKKKQGGKSGIQAAVDAITRIDPNFRAGRFSGGDA